MSAKYKLLMHKICNVLQTIINTHKKNIKTATSNANGSHTKYVTSCRQLLAFIRNIKTATSNANGSHTHHSHRTHTHNRNIYKRSPHKHNSCTFNPVNINDLKAGKTSMHIGSWRPAYKHHKRCEITQACRNRKLSHYSGISNYIFTGMQVYNYVNTVGLITTAVHQCNANRNIHCLLV